MKTIFITSQKKKLPSLSEIWEQKILLYALVNRNIKLRYKQTLLGILWVVIQPLALSGVFALIFGQFFSLSTGQEPYLAFSLASILIWQLFSRAMGDASISLTAFSSVITKVYFPRILIPLASVFTALFDFLIVLPIILALIFCVNGSIPLHVLWVMPGVVILTILFAFGLSLCFCSINIVFRDVQHVIPFILQIGFYLSPVVYGIEMVSEKWKNLYSFNPLVGIIESFRFALLSSSKAPELGVMVYSISCTIGIVIVGAYLFSRVEQTMADRI